VPASALTRPGGSEGDNLVKTRLSTGDMADVFEYNSGSLFQAISPTKNLTPVTDEAWVSDLDEVFKSVVSGGDDVYGAPWGNITGGGIFYHIPTYEKLGLEVPTTWDEFIANSDKIKADGTAAVAQSYGDTWTSQIFVLADFHNVAAAEPSFAEDYTANKAKFATTPAALAGFEHLQEVNEKGYLTEDFASAKLNDGLTAVANGDAAHYPMITFATNALADVAGDKIDDVGFFAMPGQDASQNGATVWEPSGLYIPTTTEGEELEAAKEFLAFMASPEGCEAYTSVSPPGGPFAVTTCELPADVPQVVKDVAAYTEKDAASPALEFLSPIKGPALEQITVEVGSGITPALEGAKLYDEDVEKQAQQLGLEGW
jgi:raffinose/stachyose/melibiose transport system substrate-binding protein